MQFFFMIPNLLFGKAIGITSGAIARKVGADTWTSMLIGFIIGIGVMALLTYLCFKFPDKTIIQFTGEILGKWAGKLVGIMLALFFAVAYGTSANVMTLHLSEYFLPQTPFFLLCLLYTAVCTYGVFLGVEVILRFSVLGFFMQQMINLTMLVGTFSDFQWNNMLPVFEHGAAANLLSCLPIFTDIAMGILGVAILYPMLNNREKSVRLTFWALVISAISVLIWPFFETGVIGADMMEKYVVCCMQQVRSAQFTKYLPRYELLMVSFFAFTVYVQSVAMFHCASYCIKQTIGIKKNRYIMIPLTVVLVFITYIQARDDNKFVLFLSGPWSWICAALSVGLPLILFVAALLRGKLKSGGKPAQ
jgi:spore germination protein KB